MSSPWKAGDTCQIKPSRLHGVAKAKCAALWTIDSLDSQEACVHNGAPGHADIRTAPGLTCAARVPLSCLLPAGDAHPTVAAKMGAEVLALKARIAELEEAARWRVTAEEKPEQEGWFLLFREGPGFEERPFEVAKFDGSGWESEWTSVGCLPDRWQPIRKPGAS